MDKRTMIFCFACRRRLSIFVDGSDLAKHSLRRRRRIAFCFLLTQEMLFLPYFDVNERERERWDTLSSSYVSLVEQQSHLCIGRIRFSSLKKHIIGQDSILSLCARRRRESETEK